jgi:DNA-binding SARP family transcriptional activator
MPQGQGRAALSRLPVHLEDSEWSRLALGIAGDSLASFGLASGVDVVQLGPDSITLYPTATHRSATHQSGSYPSSSYPSGSYPSGSYPSGDEPPPWPFARGRVPGSWSLPRDSRTVASVPLTPAIAGLSRKAALVTLSEMHGRRALVDLVAASSTILTGAPAEVGVKLADIAAELGSRRWSDLDTLILVGFDGPIGFSGRLPRPGGTRHVEDVSAALDEVTARSMGAAGSPSICVIVPPWASDPEDQLLGELVRYSEQTEGVGVLCCASAEGALCVWELASDPAGQPVLSFKNGRRIIGVDLTEVEEPAVKARIAPPAAQLRPAPGLGVLPIEVAVLGSVQVHGTPESFRHRRRLTELVAFLAMHPEGTTTDTFATALWPDRRVPVQTLANRLSETRRALGRAGDGRPRLRKQGRRHLIMEAGTDWDRFKELAAEPQGAESWRRALALVRGRPFDGLDRGEWVHLEGFAAAIEAAVVDVACRLGGDALERGDGGLAHWAALQGLLASPWDERLYRLLMRAADQLGNRGGVDAALRSLALALELEGDPLLGIHPETSALYRRLTSRSRT